MKANSGSEQHRQDEAQQEMANGEAPSSGWSDEDADAIQPLTAEQAAVWRTKHWQPSPWKILQWQAVFAIAIGVLIWVFCRDSVAIIAWFYGTLAIWLPALLFAKVVVSKPELGVLVMFEMLKLLLSVVLIGLAPLLLEKVAWMSLLGGVVLTVNMYWIAPILMARSRRV